MNKNKRNSTYDFPELFPSSQAKQPKENPSSDSFFSKLPTNNKYPSVIINNTTNHNITIINQFLEKQQQVEKSKPDSKHKIVHFNLDDYYKDISEKQKQTFYTNRSDSFLNLSLLNEESKQKKFDGKSPNKNYAEHTKEEIKLLYKSKGEQCVYDKQFGNFYGFVACTFKNYKSVNEDKLRISINNPLSHSNDENEKENLNNKNDNENETPLNNQVDNKNWNCQSSLEKNKNDPNNVVNFFGLFDGHRGDGIAKYLKDTFHIKYLQQTSQLINDPFNTLFKVFIQIESTLHEQYLKDLNTSEATLEKSGSCALVLINLHNKIIIANCGDSRAFTSLNLGQTIYQLSLEHKPNKESEKNRIQKQGGKVICNNETHNIHRIFPSGLNVSRTIGDFEFKTPETGGFKNMISSKPDIIEIEYNPDMDFIVLGSDGVFDKVSNSEIVQAIYNEVLCGFQINASYVDILAMIGDAIINKAIDNGSKDNLSVVVLIMNNLYETIQGRKKTKIEQSVLDLKMKVNETNSFYPKWIRLKREEEINDYKVTHIENDTPLKQSLAFEGGKDKDIDKRNCNLKNNKKKKWKFSNCFKNCKCCVSN